MGADRHMAGPETNGRAKWVTTALEEFEGRLTLYASRMLCDEHKARDVVQETFLRLCRQDRSRLEGHLAPWLYTVCRRLVLDEMRRNGRMAHAAETTLDRRPGAEPDPAEFYTDVTA